eukprot:comp20681_c0_seq1/m.42333 comp20681_c0_seq1/g.42333  ORF comp20681_c0_seq1/g.42333 comp20681_c0_seq1/m.42333 type:complete len:301 (+) comp20681_c0_seq1:16-918(+)
MEAIVIDDNVPSRSNRHNVTNSKFTKIGLAIARHAKRELITVLLFAEDYTENPSAQKEFYREFGDGKWEDKFDFESDGLKRSTSNSEILGIEGRRGRRKGGISFHPDTKLGSTHSSKKNKKGDKKNSGSSSSSKHGKHRKRRRVRRSDRRRDSSSSSSYSDDDSRSSGDDDDDSRSLGDDDDDDDYNGKKDKNKSKGSRSSKNNDDGDDDSRSASHSSSSSSSSSPSPRCLRLPLLLFLDDLWSSPWDSCSTSVMYRERLSCSVCWSKIDGFQITPMLSGCRKLQKNTPYWPKSLFSHAT